MVGLGIPTPVVKKSTIIWDITPYSQLKANRRFGETYRLNIPEDSALENVNYTHV
jgi:hypothetical protein